MWQVYRNVPGAILRKSQGQLQGLKYVTADGGEIKNNGEYDIVFRAPDGSMRKTTFQNADVGLPIFSLNQVARDNHRVILDDDRGVLIHKLRVANLLGGARVSRSLVEVSASGRPVMGGGRTPICYEVPPIASPHP